MWCFGWKNDCFVIIYLWLAGFLSWCIFLVRVVSNLFSRVISLCVCVSVICLGIDFNDLAERTRSFNGAEIEGLVKSAANTAMNGHMKVCVI